MKLSIVIISIAFAYAVSAEVCEIDYIASHMNLTETDREFTSNICEKCMTEYNLPLKMLVKVELKTFFAPSCSLKCYYKCYFQTYGSMDLKGNWVPSAIEEKMSEENFQAAIECIGQSDSEDLCEKAYKLYACYVKRISRNLINVE